MLASLKSWLLQEAQIHQICNAAQLSDDQLKAAVEQAWNQANGVQGEQQS